MSVLEGKVDVPGLGQVDKKVLLGVGGVAAAFVAWKWWQASAGSAEEYAPEDPGFEGEEVLPSVEGAVRPDNGYGLPDDEPPSTDDFGFRGKTNAEWTQYAAARLSQSDRWDYADIVVALGKYLAGAPLDSVQVQIVQAAIGLAGNPPVGNHPVISAPSSSVGLPAPSGLRASGVTHEYVLLDWNSVAGASKYVVRRDGTQIELSGDTQMGVRGLKPSTTYAFTVTAEGLDGKEGTAASLSVTTKAAPSTSTPTPTTPKPSDPKAPPSKLRYRTMRITRRGQTLSQLVAEYNKKYKTSHSWQTIWDYNLKNRPPATAATLRKRGPNKVYIGSSFWFPY